MTKKIWIFGDSYASRDHDDAAWPARLENIYEVTNFAKVGTSVDWSLQQMINADKDTDTKDITVIFFLTEQNRQYWKFWKTPSHHCLSKHLASTFKIPKTIQPFAKKYRRHVTLIKDVYKYRDDDFESRSIIKSIGTINLYSSNFEKILIWPCFDDIELNCKLNENVIIASPCMNKFETVVDNMTLSNKDPLPNHLTEAKHKEMLEMLVKWIDRNEI